MMTRILTRGYLWLLLALLYSPILIIMIAEFNLQMQQNSD